MQIDTGDIVRHEPTGEEWLVAYVVGERLAWVGWPEADAVVAAIRGYVPDRQWIHPTEMLAW